MQCDQPDETKISQIGVRSAYRAASFQKTRNMTGIVNAGEWASRVSADPYQFVIEPSGRKYVCARAVTRCVISAICFNGFMSNSTPKPERSLG